MHDAETLVAMIMWALLHYYDSCRQVWLTATCCNLMQ